MGCHQNKAIGCFAIFLEGGGGQWQAGHPGYRTFKYITLTLRNVTPHNVTLCYVTLSPLHNITLPLVGHHWKLFAVVSQKHRQKQTKKIHIPFVNNPACIGAHGCSLPGVHLKLLCYLLCCSEAAKAPSRSLIFFIFFYCCLGNYLLCELFSVFFPSVRVSAYPVPAG